MATTVDTLHSAVGSFQGITNTSSGPHRTSDDTCHQSEDQRTDSAYCSRATSTDSSSSEAAVGTVGMPADATANDRGSTKSSAANGSVLGSTAAAACGPDQVAGAESLWAWSRDSPVRLRLGTDSNDMSSEAPLSVMSAFRKTVKRKPDHPALAIKVNGSWKFWTFQQYYNDVWTAAKAFIKLGLQPYNGVGIIGFNSPEWLISDMAAIFAGGLATGIYTTNQPEACHFVAHNAKCNVLVVENEGQLRKIRQVWDRLPDLKAVVQYSGQPINEPGSLFHVYSWSEFMQLSESVSDAALEERIKQQAVNKCCTLIYTSGTTGNPKGAMISHDNLVWTANAACESMVFTYAAESLVSYLPLSHVAAQIMDIYVPLLQAVTVYFAQPDALKGSLSTTLREVRPTVFLGVPRVWEKIQEQMQLVSSRQGIIRRSILSWARSVGLRGNMSVMNGGSLPFGWTLANILVFRKIRAALGLDRCHLCMTSAAPITKETLEFFLSLDIKILELFGMSEGSGPITLCRPNSTQFASAGQAMLGINVHIANPDKDGCGEVCFQGRNVFMGYLDEEAKTLETVDDQGFLHSGDIGKVDADGYLFITGRIKELLITAGGENVAPVPIEDAVKEALPCVSNCMLIGDRKKFLSILLTIKSECDKETTEPLDKLSASTFDWLRSAGCPTTCLTVTDFIATCSDSSTGGKALRAAIQAGIDKANRSAPSRAQIIQKWTILPRDFSVFGGELGPTLKLRRPIVAKMYESTIKAMYAE